jgi:hypothetical protein
MVHHIQLHQLSDSLTHAWPYYSVHYSASQEESTFTNFGTIVRRVSKPLFCSPAPTDRAGQARGATFPTWPAILRNDRQVNSWEESTPTFVPPRTVIDSISRGWEIVIEAVYTMSLTGFEPSCSEISAEMHATARRMDPVTTTRTTRTFFVCANKSTWYAQPSQPSIKSVDGKYVYLVVV